MQDEAIASEIEIEEAPILEEVPKVKRKPSKMVSMTDPKSAFQVLIRNAEPEYIAKLTKLLANWNDIMES